MHLSMSTRSFIFANVWFVTAVRGQSSPDNSLYSSATTTVAIVNTGITQPSPVVMYGWLPTATFYSSVDIDASSTVTAAVIATDLASEIAAASSTDTSTLYSSVDPDSTSTSTLPEVESDTASDTAAVSSYATSDAQDMTSQTSVEAVATSFTGSDIQQSATSTDPGADLPTSTAVDDPGVDIETNSPLAPSSTAISTSTPPTSSPAPTSSRTTTPVPTTSTTISASATPSTTTAPVTSTDPSGSPPFGGAPPQSSTAPALSLSSSTTTPTTSYAWSSSTQPTTLATQVQSATSSELAFHGGMCDRKTEHCMLYKDTENMICNSLWAAAKGRIKLPGHTLISCLPKSASCTSTSTASPSTTTGLFRKRHHNSKLPAPAFLVDFCKDYCTCKDGALVCGSVDFDNSCGNRCSNATITEACNCNWDPNQLRCIGDSNNWQLGGCACPNKGTKWPGQP